jgi:hypothetical protein
MNTLGIVQIIFGIIIVAITFFIMIIAVIIIDPITFFQILDVPVYINWLVILLMPYVIFRLTYTILKHHNNIDI